MKALRFGTAAAVISVAAMALTACGSDNAVNPGAGASSAAGTATATVRGTLTGTGATSQTAAMDAWKAGFQSANPNAAVQYSPEGSGAGRKALIAGAAQFAGSDAYLSDTEVADSKKVCGPDGAFDVPVYISPIAITFNLNGVKELNLDAETIAKIFRGDIAKWNDPAIAAQNAGAALPDLAIIPVHRSDNSGTTENFTDYLNAAAAGVWTDKPSGDWPASLTAGENNKGTSGVVSTVTSTPGAVTYADDSAVTGSLGKAKVKVGGSYSAISAEAAAAAVDAATPVPGRAAHDISLKLDRTTTSAGAYPIVLVSYHVFCSQYKDQATVDLVKAFGHYVTGSAGQQAAAQAAKSAPLSATLSDKAKAAIDTITVAS